MQRFQRVPRLARAFETADDPLVPYLEEYCANVHLQEGLGFTFLTEDEYRAGLQPGEWEEETMEVMPGCSM